MYAQRKEVGKGCSAYLLSPRYNSKPEKRELNMKKILVAIMLMISMNAFSLSDPEDGDGQTEDAIPVDGGLSLLLAAGAAYGVRSIRMRKNHDPKKY
jgi:hypothetical protein